MNLPRTVDELIDLLDQTFPLKTHSVDASLARIQRDLGTRDVIDFLRTLQSERDEDALGHLAGDLLDNE